MVDNSLSGDVMKAGSQSKKERQAAAKAKHDREQRVASKGSVGHPVHCAPACKYVKRKGGCHAGVNCPNCHHCFWTKEHGCMPPSQKSMPPKPNKFTQEACGAALENAKLKEAQSLASKLLSLLGGEEPFASEAKEATDFGSGVDFGAVAEAMKVQGGNCRGAGFSGVAQGLQERDANPATVIRLNELLSTPVRVHHEGSPEVVSTNPARGQSQQELPAAQLAPQTYPWQISVGSAGHPDSCGPACKYASKPKGCKDGRLCGHCHLCRWMRCTARPMSESSGVPLLVQQMAQNLEQEVVQL